MKILDLTTDSLVLPLRSEGVEVLHCQNSASVMHSGCPKSPPRSAKVRMIAGLIMSRRYDWIIVPPTHLNWNLGNSGVGKVIKKALSHAMRFPRLTRSVRHLVFGRKARFAVTDYSDQMMPSEFALTCIEPKHYLMLNVPRDLVGSKMGSANTHIHYLPTVMRDDLIDALVAKRKPGDGTDVFVAGHYHNEQRVKQQQAAQILAERGWKSFELKEKSFELFTAKLLDSKLCMAGRGIAYHCFRPLEAAAAGAAPICHTPENDTYHEWQHGKNCFMYSHTLSPPEIADFVEAILKAPESIPSVVAGARSLLNDRHRGSVLANEILSILRSPS